MTILKQPPKNSVSPQVIALTPLNLYYERIKSISEQLRADAVGLRYIPLQFGGILGQQESLLTNSAVNLIDFKVVGDE
jgi:hypothetical protein